IAEEYPEGFAGAELDEETLTDLAAIAMTLHLQEESRAAQISGRLANHEYRPGTHWVVSIGGREWRGEVIDAAPVCVIRLEDGTHLEVTAGPGPLVPAAVNSRERVVKVERLTGGALRMRYRGADLKARVLTPRQAELAARLPEKAPPDTAKLLLCPMPGLVVRIDVAEGEEVFDGQALCIVEAMKMENVLRAERRSVVKKIHAEPGQSMAVDEIIMEFE
ncbi:MAG TPA: biotin/lipoyl-containing protein, partial [Paracoccaceae bacterium]|nr:biotin/lipoyl-containing protein [Paracoccaceae bacterium]